MQRRETSVTRHLLLLNSLFRLLPPSPSASGLHKGRIQATRTLCLRPMACHRKRQLGSLYLPCVGYQPSPKAATPERDGGTQNSSQRVNRPSGRQPEREPKLSQNGCRILGSKLTPTRYENENNPAKEIPNQANKRTPIALVSFLGPTGNAHVGRPPPCFLFLRCGWQPLIELKVPCKAQETTKHKTPCKEHAENLQHNMQITCFNAIYMLHDATVSPPSNTSNNYRR